ncbi:MAG: hypothetical protein M9952_09750 [Microthrixaceae bacterium]|nr:hypothetical protein [Microthrixaceae bacterium]MCO5313199.1 hypothetical protein [Microthrixaceae bacterium]
MGGGTMPPGLLKKKTVPIAGTSGSPSYGDTTYAYDQYGSLAVMVDYGLG